MNPIIIREVSAQRSDSPVVRSNARVIEAYRAFGLETIEIPSTWQRYSDANTVLRKVSRRPATVPAILCGFIHTDEEYAELYSALLAKNLKLINSPGEYSRSHSFEMAYQRIRDLTPGTIAIRSLSQVRDAVATLGLPVFIKGAVQSRKDRGWKYCVAKSVREAEQIAGLLLGSYTYSEGTVMIRKHVPLRHTARRSDGFPISREFRVLLYANKPLGIGFYWPEEDPGQMLSADERKDILELAVCASTKLAVPFLAVDIAQCENGNWIVIEPGDPQTAGLERIDLRSCFGRLLEKLRA